MTTERWTYLVTHRDAKLTPEELHDGWHWCPDWDYLLIGPGMDELEGCTCGVPDTEIL